jgi:hypothetical protein
MMRPFGELLVALAGMVPARAGSRQAGLALRVSSLDLTLPIESRIEPGAELKASLPRGRLATGFDPPLGVLSARFETGEA